MSWPVVFEAMNSIIMQSLGFIRVNMKQGKGKILCLTKHAKNDTFNA